jgi:hypothetical protein
MREIWCDECGVEITWTPVVIGYRTYCCHDCAMGLECDCDNFNPSWEEDEEFPWTEGVGDNPEFISGLEYGSDYY